MAQRLSVLRLSSSAPSSFRVFLSTSSPFRPVSTSPSTPRSYSSTPITPRSSSSSAARSSRPSVLDPHHALRPRRLAIVRHASRSTAPPRADRPIVLEKPLQFNPPSHGSRLPTKQHVPKHYGAPVSAAEREARAARDYPGMMAPEGTWAHWFWHSRAIHVFITMGTLVVLAMTTFLLNFTQTSPFRHLLPDTSELWTDPSHFFTAWVRVLQLHERDRNHRVAEARRLKVEDATKRRQFQKMHGLDKESAIVTFLGGTEEEPAVANDEMKQTEMPTTAASSGNAVHAARAEGQAAAVAATAPAESGAVVSETRKRWLGIF